MRGLILSAVAGVATLVAFAMPATAEAHGYAYGHHHYHHGYYRGPAFYRPPVVVPPVRWGVSVGVTRVAPYPPVVAPVAPVAPYGGVQVYGGVAGGVVAPVAPVVPGYYP